MAAGNQGVYQLLYGHKDSVRAVSHHNGTRNHNVTTDPRNGALEEIPANPQPVRREYRGFFPAVTDKSLSANAPNNASIRKLHDGSTIEKGGLPPTGNNKSLVAAENWTIYKPEVNRYRVAHKDGRGGKQVRSLPNSGSKDALVEESSRQVTSAPGRKTQRLPRNLSPVPAPKVNTYVNGKYLQDDVIISHGKVKKTTSNKHPQGKPPAGATRKSPTKESDTKFASSWAETRAEQSHVIRDADAAKSKADLKDTSADTKPTSKPPTKPSDPFHSKKAAADTAPEIPERLEKEKHQTKSSHLEKPDKPKAASVSPDKKEPSEKPLVREHPRPVMPKPKPAPQDQTQQEDPSKSLVENKPEKRKVKPPIPRQKTRTFIKREPTKPKIDRTKTQTQLHTQKTMDPAAEPKYTVTDAVQVYTSETEPRSKTSLTLRVKTAKKREKPAPNPYTDPKRSIPPWHRKEYVLNKREASVYVHIKKVYGNEKLRKKRENQFYNKVMELQIERWKDQHAEYAKKIEAKSLNKEEQQRQLKRLRQKFEDEQVKRFRSQYVTSRILAHEWDTRHEYGLPEDLNSSPRNQVKIKEHEKPPKQTFSVKNKHQKNVKRWKEIFRDPKKSVYGLNHKDPKMDGIDTVELDENNNSPGRGAKKMAVKEVMKDAEKMLESDDDDDDDDSMYITDSDEDESDDDVPVRGRALPKTIRGRPVGKAKPVRSQPQRAANKPQQSKQNGEVTSTMRAAHSLYGNKNTGNKKPVSNKSSAGPTQGKAKSNDKNDKNLANEKDAGSKKIPIQTKSRKPEPDWRRNKTGNRALVGGLEGSSDPKKNISDDSKPRKSTKEELVADDVEHKGIHNSKDDNQGNDESSSRPLNGSTVSNSPGVSKDDGRIDGQSSLPSSDQLSNNKGASDPSSTSQKSLNQSSNPSESQDRSKQPENESGQPGSGSVDPTENSSSTSPSDHQSSDKNKSKSPTDIDGEPSSENSASGQGVPKSGNTDEEDKSRSDSDGQTSGVEANLGDKSGDDTGDKSRLSDDSASRKDVKGATNDDISDKDRKPSSVAMDPSTTKPDSQNISKQKPSSSQDTSRSGDGAGPNDDALRSTQKSPHVGSNQDNETGIKDDTDDRKSRQGSIHEPTSRYDEEDKANGKDKDPQDVRGASREKPKNKNSDDTAGVYGAANADNSSSSHPETATEKSDKGGTTPEASGDNVNSNIDNKDSKRPGESGKRLGSQPLSRERTKTGGDGKTRQPSGHGQRKVRIKSPEPAAKSEAKQDSSKGQNTSERNGDKQKKKSTSEKISEKQSGEVPGQDKKRKKKKSKEEDVKDIPAEKTGVKKKKAAPKPLLIEDEDDLRKRAPKKKEKSMTPPEKTKRKRSGKKDTKASNKNAIPAYLQDSTRPDVPEKELQLTDDDTDSDEDIFEKAKRKYGIIIDSDDDQ